MKNLTNISILAIISLWLLPEQIVLAYPPAVGILGPAKSCLACHVQNGPWKDDQTLVIDLLDKATGQSLRQPDGTFKLTASRNQPSILLTAIGYRGSDPNLIPYRNAWLYVSPETIGNSALSKFAAGWDVNLPVACRITGDKMEGFADAHVTVLPMTILPTASAKDAVVQLQIMLTKGESVKGKPAEGMIGSYFERTLYLRIQE